MKTYKHLFEKMLPAPMVAKCALDAAEQKTKRREILNAFRRFDKTYDHVIACALDPDYSPCDDNRHKIVDGANHKTRDIEKPKFCPEQILHHMLIEPFKPVLMNGLYEQVYGSLPTIVERMPDGRLKIVKNFGPHAAARQLAKWVQTGKKIYVCETDVHHAYGSVNIPILVNQLQRVIKDKEWLRLAYKFIHYDPKDPKDGCGLIIGHFISPWLFNFYVKRFDHYAATLEDVKYLRFADNIYLVGTNKRKVHKALNLIRKYLRVELKLELNKSTQVYRFEYKDRRNKVRGRPVNAVGAVIHYNRVTLRKGILLRMRRKAIRINRKETTTWYDGASMLSRLAWIGQTDTKGYYKRHIKPLINTRQLKIKVRNHNRAILPVIEKRRRIIYDGLERSVRLHDGEACRI